MTYRFVWKNNPKRAALYGRRCHMLARGTPERAELCVGRIRGRSA